VTDAGQVRPQRALAPIEEGAPLTPNQVYFGARSMELAAWQGWARAARAKLEARLQEDPDSGREEEKEEIVA